MNDTQIETNNNYNSNNICSICIQDMLENQTTVILKCRHKYHFKCFANIIDMYDRREIEEIRCPYCRTEINDISIDQVDNDIRTAVFNDSSSSSGSTILQRQEEIDQLANAMRNESIETVINRTFNISSIQNFYHSSHYHVPGLSNR